MDNSIQIYYIQYCSSLRQKLLSKNIKQKNKMKNENKIKVVNNCEFVKCL